ncbi:RHS repeat-associated core domain-containing protein [Phenylobacterium sp.]|uniref:RHS repeat-associated core domain-containing protein n=1 Tax=Phenylobacterium sp. TaxID=1871053 RepID=UPI00122747B6|nr:MAG: hypothetical protein E8A12_13380 [Phenylobacterium sp.]
MVGALVPGRFLQTDPIRYNDGPNIYAYVHGDPVNGVDPGGTDDPFGVSDSIDDALNALAIPLFDVQEIQVDAACSRSTYLSNGGSCDAPVDLGINPPPVIPRTPFVGSPQFTPLATPACTAN